MTSTSATTTTASPASYENLTPLAFLGRSAATFPDREAVIYGTRRRTYAQFEAEVQQLARALAKSIKPGQVVSFVALTECCQSATSALVALRLLII